MNKEIFNAGIDKMIEGLELLKQSAENCDCTGYPVLPLEKVSSKLTAKSEELLPLEVKKASKAKAKVEVVPVVEETEEVENSITAEELADLDIASLKELAKEIGVEVKKNDNSKSLVKRILTTDMETIVTGLTTLGYFDEESEEEVIEEDETAKEEAEEVDETVAMIEAMSVEELAEALTEVGLSTKGKKEALVDRVLKAIEEGVIVLSEDGEEEELEEIEETEETEDEEDVSVEDIINELDDEQIKELATSLSIPTTVAKKMGGKVKKSDVSIDALKEALVAHADVEQALVDAGYVAGDDVVEETEEETNANDYVSSPERVKAEQKVEADIRAQYKAKKLKDSAIDTFNKSMYVGDPDCGQGCKGCDGESKLDCYIELKKKFVDDSGTVQPEKEAYERDGAFYCCGRELQDDNSCGVCGTEYSEE